MFAKIYVAENDWCVFCKWNIIYLWPVFKDLHLQYEPNGLGHKQEVEKSEDRLIHSWFWYFLFFWRIEPALTFKCKLSISTLMQTDLESYMRSYDCSKSWAWDQVPGLKPSMSHPLIMTTNEYLSEHIKPFFCVTVSEKNLAIQIWPSKPRRFVEEHIVCSSG